MKSNPYECNTVPLSTHCKCCDQLAKLAGLVDFSKSCADTAAGKKTAPHAGWPVYYYQCTACGFTFTRALDQWQNADFAQHIYNDDYVRHDPDYLGVRPHANAKMLLANFGQFKNDINLLDYGSGLGLMGDALDQSGFSPTVSYDPYSSAQRPDRQFNMVTCFEVFEHVPDPIVLLKDLDSLLSPDGAILFSTLLRTEQVAQAGISNWWYCAPRNGHISFYTNESLRLLAARFELRVHSFSAGLHVMHRPTLAPWLKSLMQPKQN